ncbi:beta-1 [Perilla frutescens var. frutescens]|nr:beta-1 [Perilla frutescens var. frutescens]
MEGLIPFLIHAMKKQTPPNSYRCLSENSTTSRSYHLLLADGGGGGSSHRRTRSHVQLPSTVDFSSGSDHLTHLKSFTPAVAPSDASHYQVSGTTRK